jgi:hypothetical protein
LAEPKQRLETFVLANVRNNEKICLKVSVFVEGGEGGDRYSHYGI